MTEQGLDDADIDAVLQQMRGVKKNGSAETMLFIVGVGTPASR